VVVTAAPIIGPACERISAALNHRAHLGGEADQIPDVVQRQQPQPQQLAGDEQVPQVPARVGRARLAIAARIQRALVGAERGVADVQRAIGDPPEIRRP
jgi:hypothetical protein